MTSTASYKTGLYVGSVTIYPPNTREVTSAREAREEFDAKQSQLVSWYEALYLGVAE